MFCEAIFAIWKKRNIIIFDDVVQHSLDAQLFVNLIRERFVKLLQTFNYII